MLAKAQGAWRSATRVAHLAQAVVSARDLSDVALKLLPLLAKRGLAAPAAWLVHRSIEPITPQPGRHRVLIIKKAVFNEDVASALEGVAGLQLFGINRAVLKAMAVGILPRHICADDTYVSDDPVAQKAKKQYRAFLADVWRHLERLGRWDAVLTGNWAYWAERELGAVLEDNGVPFIVLHKEGIKPPARSELLRYLFRKTRGQFMGRRMLVYHEAEREHQLKGDIARDDQITIVGMARMDRMHEWRRLAARGEVAPAADRPLVLFAAFLPNNFLPSYSGLDSDLAWDGLAQGCLRAMARLARDNPGIDVIVRPRGFELAEVQRLMKPLEPLPPNLSISSAGDVVPLIQQAWVVCAHNTTVLFEALAAGKPVIMPRFAEACDERYAGYIVDPGAAVKYAASEDELVAVLSQACSKMPRVARDLSAEVREALAYWTGNADGRAAERVRAAILGEIATTRDATT